MKRWIKRWINISTITVLVIVFLSLSSFYIFVTLRSKAVITEHLSRLFGKEVSVGMVKMENPLLISIGNLEIKDVAKVKQIYESPRIFGLLTGRLALNRIKIVEPEIIIENMAKPKEEPAPDQAEQAQAAEQPEAPVASAPASEPQQGKKAKKDLYLVIKRFSVKEGKVKYIDKAAGKEGIIVRLEDLNVDVDNFYAFSKSAITDFSITGVIPWAEGAQAGKLNASGWFNSFKKDMQAKVKVEGIDAVYLAPYYENYVSIEKARIEKAKLNFTADIQGHDNDVTSECKLELIDIVFRTKDDEQKEERAQKIVSAVMDMFRASSGGKIVLNFTIKTKMDKPIFGFENIKMAIEERVQRGIEERKFDLDDLLGTPGKLLSGTLIGAKDISKSIISGTFSIGRKLMPNPFKKDKKEEEKKEEAPKAPVQNETAK